MHTAENTFAKAARIQLGRYLRSRLVPASRTGTQESLRSRLAAALRTGAMDVSPHVMQLLGLARQLVIHQVAHGQEADHLPAAGNGQVPTVVLLHRSEEH